MNHKVDQNDYQYALERGYNVIGWVPCPRGEKGKINPQVTQFALADGSFLSVFSSKPKYYETIANTWRPINEITSYHGNHRVELNYNALIYARPEYISWLHKRCVLIGGYLQYPNYISPYTLELTTNFVRPGLTTTTVYPDPDPETTTVDGHIRARNANWNTAHDATSGDLVNDSDTTVLTRVAKDGGSQFQAQRGVFLFDTSSITDTDTLDSATFSLNGFEVKDEVASDPESYVAVVSSSPASNTGLVVGDIDAVGDAIDNPTKFSSDLDLGSAVTSAYNDFVLNASGEAAVDFTGVTKLGLREGHDIEDNLNSINSNGEESHLWVYSADQTGTTQDPKLAVVHSAGGGGGAFIPKIAMLN